MRHCIALVLALTVLAGCGAPPTPTPDLVATQIAVEEAAHATMTARVPTATNTAQPTDTLTPTPTDTATPVPTDTPPPTDTPTPTQTPSPTSTPTDLPTPTGTPSPTPSHTPTPEPKPTEKPTARPTPTTKPASLDRYRVYYSNYSGTTVAQSQNTLSYSIWSMRGDGQEATQLFTEAQQPALSSDGTKLAYVHLSSGIFVHDLTTEEQRQVINETSAMSPSFSPGGYRLVWAAYIIARWWQVFVADSTLHITNADGTNDMPIVLGRRPAWSPTSNLILYEACEGTRCGIKILNTDTGNTWLLVANSAGKASWSPDGQTITYSTDADGDSEIWSIRLDGTAEQKLTDNQSTDALAAWSPDGQYLYFLSDRKGGWGIWIMRPDGSEPRRIRSIGLPPYWQWAKLAVWWNK
jgi:WD40 repeat protein